MQLRQYPKGHINWFYTKNNSLNIIGGHLGFWQIWWYVIFFRIFHPFCHHQKHMYRGKFCISLMIRIWDKKIIIFYGAGGGGGGGGCLLDFHEGQLFFIYLFKSQKAFRMSTLFECRYSEDNFLVQSGDWNWYEIRFCKEVYISPTPKSLFSNIMCNGSGSCAA